MPVQAGQRKPVQLMLAGHRRLVRLVQVVLAGQRKPAQLVQAGLGEPIQQAQADQGKPA